MRYENDQFRYFKVWPGIASASARQMGKYLAVMHCNIARAIFGEYEGIRLCVVDDFGNLVGV